MHKKFHDDLNYAMRTKMSMLEEWQQKRSEHYNPNHFNISYFRNLQPFFVFSFHIYVIDCLDSCFNHFITLFFNVN